MGPERRNRIVLAVVLVTLAGAVYRALAPQAGDAGSAGIASVGPTRRADGVPATINAPDVRLEALDRERVRPDSAERNLFRFRTRAAVAPTRGPGRAGPPPAPMPTGPPGPPPAPVVPPIALKFIGVVEATEKSQTYAVLRDDRGVYHGREGDIIEGRYRILRIGAESIDLAYVDGRGRQTLRLGS